MLRIGKKIFLQQTTYLIKYLKRFQMPDCTLVSIPMNLGVAYSLLCFESQADIVTIKWYQSAISLLIWSSLHT